MLCAIVGDQIGYWIGRSAGAALYRREDSFFFSREAICSELMIFIKNMGGRACHSRAFRSHFSNVLPPVAGAAMMPYGRYLPSTSVWHFVGRHDDLGGLCAGALGPNIAQRIHYVIAVVILVSVLPVIVSLLRARGGAAAPTAEEK